jgi:hypothetical protein
MELIEIRNSLLKLSFNDDERPILGQFTALTADDKSYVAQFVNIKCDETENHAIARLIFTYTNDGIVDEYDGSIPSKTSAMTKLEANELLDLLPVETPVKIGKLAQQPYMLKVDISLFERNFTVFSEHDSEKVTVISNLARQLFRLKEKCIIIDNSSVFEDYPIIKLGTDFKLPLNSEMIDFIFDYELKEVDPSTKAVIQDIFYAVQQYINSMDDKFISIESFIDVVTDQYKETQMPELALLKNKLLKYQQAGVFADTKEEYMILKDKLSEKNCLVINLSDIGDEFQKEVITFVHKILETFDKYVYFFVPLNDMNSDKKLIKRLINHEHVFTTVFASHSYKYAQELKEHAQNMLIFAPMTTQHDFASYNTFLSKLNQNEAIMYGKLTQGIPFIVDIEELDLDLTKDDVFGDKTTFVPAIEEAPEEIAQKVSETVPAAVTEAPTPEPEQEVIIPQEDVIDDAEDFFVENSIEEVPTEEYSEVEEYISAEELPPDNTSNTIPPIDNIMALDENEEDSELIPQENDAKTEYAQALPEDNNTTKNEDVLTEDDLDFLEANQEINEDDGDDLTSLDDFESMEETPVVPVYSPDEGEEVVSDENIGFSKGDNVTHPRYGTGVVEKVIKYGNKSLCSISFDNVGRRLLDPTISELQKI